MSDGGTLAAPDARPGFEAELMAGVRRLFLEAAAAQAVTAMRAHGLRPILLKGPAIERRFYPEGLRRPYGDVDLLVAPREFDAAGEVLLELRYRLRFPDQWLGVRRTELPTHGVEFYRQGDGASEVDLHWTIHWARADPELVWSELSAGTEQMTIGGGELEVLGVAAQAMIASLHAVQHGVDEQKPLHDLRYALDRLDAPVWAEAAQIARRIDAAEPFAAGLRMLPAGASLADQLELTRSEPAEVRLLRDGEAVIALALEQALAEPSWRGRAQIIWAKLVLPPDFIRFCYPVARTGTIGLACGYVQRMGRLVRRAPRALAAWRRAHR